jgi:predicted RNase H-like HicB family nuclease
MQRTVTYTIFISRRRDGYAATCPALLHCVTFGRSRSATYRAIKDQIRRRLTSLFERHQQVPPDTVVSVKYLRLDLRELRQAVELQ